MESNYIPMGERSCIKKSRGIYSQSLMMYGVLCVLCITVCHCYEFNYTRMKHKVITIGEEPSLVSGLYPVYLIIIMQSGQYHNLTRDHNSFFSLAQISHHTSCNHEL